MTSFLAVIMVAGLIIYENTHAMSIEHEGIVRKGFSYYIAKCSKEYGAPKELIQAAEETGQIEILDRCLLKCILTGIGVVNDKGLLNPEKAEEIFVTFSPSEDYQKSVKDQIKTCTLLNDQEVNDDKEDCKRANLLYHCFFTLKI